MQSARWYPRGGQTINLHCAVPRGLYRDIFYLLLLPYRRVAFIRVADTDNYGPIARLYLWQRGSAVASSWIKSRIRFRGEGESVGGAMDRSVWDLWSFTRFSLRARNCERHTTIAAPNDRKIDAVDSPATIRATFVTTGPCRCLHCRNMEILFAFPRTLRIQKPPGKRHT